MNENQKIIYSDPDENLDNTEDMTLKGEVYQVVDLEFPTLGYKIDNVCIIDMDYWKDMHEYYDHEETHRILYGDSDYSMIIDMSYDEGRKVFNYYPRTWRPEIKQLVLESVYKYGYTTFMLIQEILSMDGDGYSCGTVHITSNIFDDIEATDKSLENSRAVPLESDSGTRFIDTLDFYDYIYPNSIGFDGIRRIIHKRRPGKNTKISILFEGEVSGLFSVFCDPCCSGSIDLSMSSLSEVMYRDYRTQKYYAALVEFREEIVSLYMRIKGCTIRESVEAVKRAMITFDPDIDEMIQEHIIKDSDEAIYKDSDNVIFKYSDMDLDSIELKDDPVADLLQENSRLKENIKDLEKALVSKPNCSQCPKNYNLYQGGN